MDHDWWMHSHEDSRPKKEGDQVAFKGINQKGKRRQVHVYFCFCFMLFAFLSLPRHPSAPIIMCRLAMLYFFLITYKNKTNKD